MIGHGFEVDERVYCCAHCAREAEGISEIQDGFERTSSCTVNRTSWDSSFPLA